MSSRRAIQLFSPAVVLACPSARPLLHQFISTRTISDRKVRRPLHRAPVPKPRTSRDESREPLAETLLDFRTDVADGNLSNAIELYPLLAQNSVLGPGDTLELARLLHNRYRRLKSLDTPQTEAKEQLLGYVKRLIADLVRRKIRPHPLASLHILSYCKESQEFDVGVEFWEWILPQDGAFLDARTYGAGIELLAYYGKPLHYLESLYTQALKRYPGAFSEYHLSPQAIVQDPSRPSIAPGSRLLLLQGILTARLVHGDWRNAYLALDTALRLYPDQVPLRFFELFIYERPLNEAYEVFHVACRSGCPPTERAFTTLLSRLAAYQLGCQTVLQRIDVLECMLTGLQAHHGAGGRVVVWHLNKITQAILQILPSASLPLRVAAYEPLFKMMDSTAKLLINILSELGVSANTATFNAFISEGGKLKRPDMVASALQRLYEAGLEPNVLTRRCLLLAAGRIRDAAGVEGAWHSIVESAVQSDSKVVSGPEWTTLVKAGIRAGNVAFVKEQFRKYKSSLPEHIVALEEELDLPTQVGAPVERAYTLPEETEGESGDSQVPPMDPLPEILRKLGGISDQLNDFRNSARSSQPYDFYTSPLNIQTPKKPQEIDKIPDCSYRDFYNKLSTERGSGIAAKEEESPTTRTLTGFTLAELRYQNWKAINELLIMSDDAQATEARKVEQALKAGKPVIRSPWSIGNKGSRSKLASTRGMGTPASHQSATGVPLDDGDQLGSPSTPGADASALELATEAAPTSESKSKAPAWMAKILNLRGYNVNGYRPTNTRPTA
ncbi:MAG: hypothetical protein M1840_005706 [Geoglossum simile]|nr:MAG: hypothetical protein M1840_005706 [Geoglossum simile]